MSKVSILMAVYNAEAYLEESLGSLLRQTFRDFEVICVDDASTDQSLQVLRRHAARDARIRVIHQERNTGQAHARNVGLGVATGDYVAMLDADDWLADDALAQAVGTFGRHPDADSVLFRVMNVEEDGTLRPYPMAAEGPFSGEEAFRLSLSWQIHGVYMVRLRLHQAHPYDETVRLYSDDNTTRIHYLLSREVHVCSGIYYYRQHAASATHRVDGGQFLRLRANESMKRQMTAHGVASCYVDAYEAERWLTLVDTYRFFFVHRRQLSADERKDGLAEMRRVWAGMETGRLPRALKYKFGYMTCRPFWLLFRCQEELYFVLKRLARRL